jgi:hypothetical protein
MIISHPSFDGQNSDNRANADKHQYDEDLELKDSENPPTPELDRNVDKTHVGENATKTQNCENAPLKDIEKSKENGGHKGESTVGDASREATATGTTDPGGECVEKQSILPKEKPKTFRQVVLSPLFVTDVVWISVHRLRSWLFVGMFNPWITQLACGDRALGLCYIILLVLIFNFGKPK